MLLWELVENDEKMVKDNNELVRGADIFKLKKKLFEFFCYFYIILGLAA